MCNLKKVVSDNLFAVKMGLYHRFWWPCTTKRGLDCASIRQRALSLHF